MISRINEAVLKIIQKYNSEFNSLTLNNNILKYQDEQINLQNFNLETIFESYQLKLDISNMKAKDLFKIIKLNAIIFNTNEEGV